MIIAIDFDGTIVENRYPEIGVEKEGAKEAINKLFDAGHHIIIWTCRNDKLLLDATVWLAREGFRFHDVNESDLDNMLKYGGDTRKIFADVYIDDRGLYPLPEWREIYEQVNMLDEAKKKALNIRVQESYREGFPG